MSTKNNPGKWDCWANADPDEPLFVLLGRDQDAPTLVECWADRREARGEDPAKVAEARACAMAMHLWHESLLASDAALRIGVSALPVAECLRRFAVDLEAFNAHSMQVEDGPTRRIVVGGPVVFDALRTAANAYERLEHLVRGVTAFSDAAERDGALFAHLVVRYASSWWDFKVAFNAAALAVGDERRFVDASEVAARAGLGNCRCALIQAEDPLRHFMNCPKRAALPEGHQAKRVSLEGCTTAELRAELARRLGPNGPDCEDRNIPLGAGASEDTHVGRYHGVCATEREDAPRALFLDVGEAERYLARIADVNSEVDFIGAGFAVTRVDAVLSVLNDTGEDPFADRPLDEDAPSFTVRTRGDVDGVAKSKAVRS